MNYSSSAVLQQPNDVIILENRDIYHKVNSSSDNFYVFVTQKSIEECFHYGGISFVYVSFENFS